MTDSHAAAADSSPSGVWLDRYDAAVGLTLALAALAVYVVTLAPGILESDSAELQTQAVRLGYAHPTGYPVYLLLAKLATWLPVGAMAYRVNLLSAIMAAATTAELYLLGRLLTGRRGAAAVGAVAMAVSPTFWSQAIIAKVYTSGLAVMVGVLLCMELWRQRGRPGWLLAAGALGGISLGVHVTHALMAPAVLVVLLLTPRGWKAQWTAAVLGAAAGVAVTLAAFWIIDRTDSPTSYFRTVIRPSRSLWNLGPDDLDTFWGRVRLCYQPPQYKVLLFSKSLDETGEKAQWYENNLPREFPWPWLALAAAGVWRLTRQNPKMTLLLVLTYGIHLGYDWIYDMGGIHVLYLATYVPIVLFGAAGLAWMAEMYPAHSVCRLKQRHTECAGYIAALAVVLWPLLWPSAWTVEGRRACQVPPGEDPFLVNYAPTCGESMDRFHDRVRLLVRDLEPDAVVFTGWCLLYPYYYVAHVEQGRTDLVFFQDYPHPYYFELADSAVEFTELNAPHRPVYFTHVVRKVAEKFEMTPVVRGRDTLYRVGAKKK